MSHRHVALLVEDDPVMAAEIADILTSIGHDLVHADSLEGGRALLAQGGLCYALLDLQIKHRPNSLKPDVIMGETLYREVRGQYPRRNAADAHLFQALIMSGFDKEHDAVVRMLRAGADAFIRKPLCENQIRIDVQIREALERSGRQRHARCAEISRAAAAPLLLATPGLDPASRLVIPGDALPLHAEGQRRLVVLDRWSGGKCWVDVDGVPAGLSPKSFIMVARLAEARVFGKGIGWLYKTLLDKYADVGWKGMTRLYEQLRRAGVPPESLIENDRRGSFRARHEAAQIVIDLAALQQHEHEEVRRAFGSALKAA